MRSHRLLLPGLLALLVSATPAAAADPAALGERPVSAPGAQNSYPSALFDASGALTAVWTRGNCSVSPGGTFCDGDHVQASTRPFGGSFAPAQDFGLADLLFGNQTDARTAGNVSGAAVIAWEGGTNNQIHIATRDAGGAFGAVVTPADGADHRSNTQVAVAADGTAVVVWATQTGNPAVERIAYVSRAPGGSFGPVQTVGPIPSPSELSLALDAHHRAVLAWRDTVGSGVVRTAVSNGPDVTFGAATLLPGSPEGFNPVVSFGSDGVAVLAFVVTSATHQTVSTSTRVANGSFSAPVPVAGDSAAYTTPPVETVDGAGRVLIGWIDQTSGAEKVQFALRAPGQPVGAAQTVTGGIGTSPAGLTAAGGAGGRLVLAWDGGEGATARALHIATAPAGGPVGAARRPAADAGNDSSLAAAFDAEGNGVVLADRSALQPDKSTLGAIVAFPLDGAGPRLSGLAHPATGTAGVALGGFAATGTDQWSALGAPVFAYGDGATGGPSHTYGGAGTFTASVTLTDATGQATTAPLGSVAIAPAPAKKVTPPPAPTLSRVSLTHRRFRVGATPKAGTTFRFTQSGTAGVRISLLRRSVDSRHRVHLTALGSIVKRGLRTGGHRVAFTGRVRGHGLRAGTYVARLQATDTGGRRSPTITVSFRILAPTKKR